MALATASLLGLSSTQALALALGRIDVLSALGEPLQAEVDLPGISEDEAASLKTTLASPEAFRAAGLVYLPGLNNLQITLQKRGERRILLLRGDSPIGSPYVDLILEARWADGRTVRGYTVLLPPPRQPQPPAPVETPVAPAAEATAPLAPAVAPAPETPQAPTAPTAEARPSNGGATSAAKPAPARTTVKYGDTAGHIAQTRLPAAVSLDQMLIALLRANPDAFVNGNVNRLKAGAVLDIPDEQQALATDAQEARRLVRAQSRDFHEYRRKLAELTPKAPPQAAGRQARGAVEARVEDKKSSAEAADKLTLSKGAVKGKTAEDELSHQGNRKEAERQADELAKNIEELKKLSAEITQTAKPAATAPAAEPAASAASAAAAPASAALVVPVAAQPPASEPVAPASPAASAPQPPASAVSVSRIDDLVANPLIPAAAGMLLALLAALGIYRSRRRAAAARPDFQEALDKSMAASAAESAVLPEEESPPAEAATPSDVVAEAEAFLAYGREQQAEDILREGLLSEPDRLAIHEKLLEIYAKRMDTANFEDIARRVQQLTGGEGLHWDQACELGIGIDPDNSLYHRSQQSEEAQPLPAVEPEQSVPFDEPAYAEASAPEAEPVATAPTIELPIPSSLDLSLDTPATPVSTMTLQVEVPGGRTTVSPEAPAEPSAADLDLDLEALSREQATPPPRPTEAAPMDFDLNAINLDLGTPATPEPPADDPLSIKLALAEEFSAIGDTDGARSLLEEVIAEATGAVRAKAEEALKKLG